jgi:hypothetical protein
LRPITRWSWIENPKRLGRLGDFLRHLDVVARWLGIAGWMVVQQATVRPTALILLDF